MKQRSGSIPSTSRDPSSQTPNGSATILDMPISRGHMWVRAEAAGAAAWANLLPVLPSQSLCLTLVIDLAWHLLQQLLLASRQAGMQACLGLFPEGLFLAAQCSLPTLGQAGELLSVQQGNR